jgi:hypothetical protein
MERVSQQPDGISHAIGRNEPLVVARVWSREDRKQQVKRLRGRGASADVHSRLLVSILNAEVH